MGLSSNWDKLQAASPSGRKSKGASRHRSRYRKPEGKKTTVAAAVPTAADASRSPRKVGKYVAMDCEFVGTGPHGAVSELARVSLVDYEGKTVLDEYVRPKHKVTDYRTWVSGVTANHLRGAMELEDAQKKVKEILDGRILVGHSIAHDLDVIGLSHPRPMIRDTAKHPPFRQKYAAGKTPSLKKLSEVILGERIQTGEHSSVEDARATMLIYKHSRNEIELRHKQRY